MTEALRSLRVEAERRDAAGLRRTLRPRQAADDVLDLASNDYLGLTRDPRIVEAAVRALRGWGAGSTGSRLVTGSTGLHTQLEHDLAAFTGAGAALVFSSGYLANLGAVTALVGKGALVVSDAQNHASLVDACRLSRAEVRVTPHREVAALDEALRRRTTGTVLVVTDSVFSVDGDLAPLAEIYHVSRRHGALLLVDEAHALGVIGPGGAGGVAAAGLEGQPDIVRTVTLSKSLGSQGGAVLGDPAVVEQVVNTARTFIFDTGLAPASVAAASAALAVLRAEPELPEAVRRQARALARAAAGTGRSVTRPAGAVVSILVGEPARTVAAQEHLLAHGVRVGCFRPPSVPDGTSRLRLTARADLTDAEVATVGTALCGAFAS